MENLRIVFTFKILTINKFIKCYTRLEENNKYNWPSEAIKKKLDYNFENQKDLDLFLPIYGSAMASCKLITKIKL